MHGNHEGPKQRKHEKRDGEPYIVENTPRSKINHNNQKRDATKRKLNQQQKADRENHHEKSVTSGKKLGVDDKQQTKINSLDQIRMLTPPPRSPPDKDYGKCKLNIAPIIDEYEVINSEDEVERNYKYRHELNDDNETSDALIRTFRPQNYNDLGEEVQQVTQKQGLSPRRLKHEKFHFQNKERKKVTSTRPNTWLFSSRIFH